MTKNFKLEEFNCKSGAPMPLSVRVNIERLANNLQALRDEIGKPITITSGYRSRAHNKAVGGAQNSQHILGTAADFKVAGMTPKHVATVIEVLIAEGKMEEGGLKAYRSWIHYDCRLVRARW
jgi:uncharacterized protein YcbK (DUF882 family)